MVSSTRRQFFKVAGALAAGGALSACGATPTPQVIREVVTQVVEREVTTIVEGTPKVEVVKETVVVEQVVTATAVVEPPTPTRAAGEKVKLTFEWPQYTPEKQRYGEYIINTYMEQNPDVVIEPMYNTNPTEKLTISIAGGTPPDCGWFGAGWPEFWRRFLPLDDLIERDAAEIKYDEFFPKLVGATQWLGKRYVMPMGFTCTLMYFNKVLFDGASTAYPTDDWTWDDLMTMGQAITKEDGSQYGVMLDMGSWWAPTFQAGPWADEQWKKAGFDNEIRVHMVQLWKDLWNKDKIAAPPTVTGEQGTMPMFESGKIGMFAGGSWALEPFRKLEFDWDIVPLPALKWTDGNHQGTGMWTEELFVMDATKYVDDAWNFVKWASGTELLTWAADQGHVVPGRQPIAESDAFIKTTQKPANIQAFLVSAGFAIPASCHPAASKISKAIGDPVSAFFAVEETQSAQEACTNANSALQTVLDEWWAKEGAA
ncbi:MAG: ABC transporter substrate-binding protein [Anaerolineae bacterium]